MDGNTVKPVFIKGRDLATKTSEFDVCTAVAKQIGHNNVLGGQRIRGLWRIYLTDSEARKILITNQLSFQGHQVHVYDENPFRAGLSGPEDDVTKITVKDLPISYGHDEVKCFMEANSVKVRKIEYSKARNPVTRELSKFYNGDRIIFADKLTTSLPRSTDIAGQKVRIFHDGQELPKRDILCTKCLGKDHTRSRCQKPEDWCKLCQTQGHKPGEENCPSTTAEPQEGIRTVYGYKDPLSNHFACSVKVFGQTFTSAEHAYKYTQAINAGKPNIAEQIIAAPNAYQVKEIAKAIPYNPQWMARKEDVMAQTLQAKLDQVQEFRDALTQSSVNVLVGSAVGDYYWGSGLSSTHTIQTLVNKWPGENRLGKILTTLRTRLQAESSPNGEKGAGRVLRSQSNSTPLSTSADTR